MTATVPPPREKFDASALIENARAAMIVIARRRALVRPPLDWVETVRLRSCTVSAIDLGEYLTRTGYGGDRRWSGAVFTAPRALWRRVGFLPNPHRHHSPTPAFVLNENRAQELGL